MKTTAKLDSDQRSAAFAPEFVGTLTDEAVNAFVSWATDNRLPRWIADLVDDLALLGDYAGRGQAENVPGLAEAIARTSNTVAEMGGSFRSLGGFSRAREPIAFSLESKAAKVPAPPVKSPTKRRARARAKSAPEVQS